MEKKAEQASVAEAICQVDDIEPLSGKPFFHLILQKSHVKSPYQLVIPSKISRLVPSKAVPAILTCGCRMWEMKYHGDNPTHKRLELPRWRTFVADNGLKVGDVCVFELMESGEKVKFKVQILRGDFPSALLASSKTEVWLPNKACEGAMWSIYGALMGGVEEREIRRLIGFLVVVPEGRDNLNHWS